MISPRNLHSGAHVGSRHGDQSFGRALRHHRPVWVWSLPVSLKMSSMHLSAIRKWLLQSPPIEWADLRLRDLLIGALQQGPVPQHIAIVMDGNRRFARNNKIEVVEGHNRGFEALAQVRRTLHSCVFRHQLSHEKLKASIMEAAWLKGTTDDGSLLSMRRQSDDRVCLQCREFPAEPLRS